MSKCMIQDDDRWPALVRRYANDLPSFAREVCGMGVDNELARAFECVERPDCRVSITSHMNPMEKGVVSPLAAIALWKLFCRPDSLTVVAVPLGDMLRCCEQYGVLAKQIAGPASWLLDYLHITATRISIRVSCRFSGGGIRFVAASERNPEHMAGFCGMDMLWLMEGASHMPSACIKVALASHCGTGMVLHARSGRIGSFVRGTRTTFNKAAGGHWDVIDLSGPEYCKQPSRMLLA